MLGGTVIRARRHRIQGIRARAHSEAYNKTYAARARTLSSSLVEVHIGAFIDSITGSEIAVIASLATLKKVGGSSVDWILRSTSRYKYSRARSPDLV